MAGSDIIATVARKGEIATAQPARFAALRSAAEHLTRRNVDRAIVEVMAEAVARLTVLAYEQDADGWANIDGATGKVLVPLPWGKVGYRRWGLRSAEANALRVMLQARQWRLGVFLYDRSRRAWHVNRGDYPTLGDALTYWERQPLTVAEYREARARMLDGA